MSKKSSATIVVKKSINKKHGSHGGSWKIAYADFMTAMMAFFLVMWLLANSSPQQRQEISEYFKMPLKTTLTQGAKSSLSSSVIPNGGGEDLMKTEGEVMKRPLKKLDTHKNETKLNRAKEKLESLVKIDPRLTNFSSNLRLSLTDDGLLIQITDSEDRPMFKLGRPTPEEYMVDILQALVPVLNDLPNRIIMTGHTDALPYANGDRGYSNWELSSDRANAARRILVSAGLASNKFMRVIGTADTLHQAGLAADDPINRRISILVLSPEKEKQIMQEDVLLTPPVSSMNGKTNSTARENSATKAKISPANAVKEIS